MQLEEMANALANRGVQNKEMFHQNFEKLLKEHSVKKEVYILRGEIVWTDGVKPGHSTQLSLNWKTSTHTRSSCRNSTVKRWKLYCTWSNSTMRRWKLYQGSLLFQKIEFFIKADIRGWSFL